VTQPEDDILRRLRLVLGGPAEPALPSLGRADQQIDRVLSQVYEVDRTAGLAGSAPEVTRWLGDIRTYFPTPVVRVLQRDALDRLGLQQLLLEPELLDEVEPDIHLVATLVSLSRVIPERTRETARYVVRQVVEDIERRLAEPLRRNVSGALNRSVHNRRPRLREVDWQRTLHANLKNYLPQQRTVVPERLVGSGRRRRHLKDVIIALDQSGSMAESVVYGAVLSSVMASVPSVTTRLVVFDTSVVDLTDQLSDPLDVLFGVQLGGGTDIGAAVDYCASRVERPQDTVMVLISDLFEGGLKGRLQARVASLVEAGVRFVSLLALTDSGHPAYDHTLAAELAQQGVAVFAATPDVFPEIMAAALSGHDLRTWAAERALI
jgi:Mg-chelatase subunit ChlD